MNPLFPEMPASVPLTYTLVMHACLRAGPEDRPTVEQVSILLQLCLLFFRVISTHCSTMLELCLLRLLGIREQLNVLFGFDLGTLGVCAQAKNEMLRTWSARAVDSTDGGREGGGFVRKVRELFRSLSGNTFPTSASRNVTMKHVATSYIYVREPNICDMALILRHADHFNLCLPVLTCNHPRSNLCNPVTWHCLKHNMKSQQVSSKSVTKEILMCRALKF